MDQWRRVAVAMTALPLLTLAGCSSGGGGSTASGGATVSGRVADGYLQGALVCLDVNGNKKCDLDEPRAESGVGGVFTLSAVELAKLGGADPALFPVLVEVPATAIDEDTGTAVGKGYVLAAPAGKPDFVSPITTLVQSRLESNPGLSVAEAEKAIKTQIGAADAVSLFENYVQPVEPSKASDLREVHKVAQVVARTMADMKAEIETEASRSGMSVTQNYDAIVKLVAEEIMNRLPTIVAKVEESGSAFNPTSIAGTVILEAPIETAAIAQRIEEKKTTTAQAWYPNILGGDGIFWLDFWPGETASFRYGNVKVDSQGNPTEGQFVRSGERWVAEGNEEYFDYILTAAGWVPYDEGASNYSLSEGTDGSILLTHIPTGMREKVIPVEYQLAGRAHKAFAGAIAPALHNETATFPAGAKGYKMTFIPQQDVFIVHSWTNDYNPGVDDNYVRYYTPSGEVRLSTLNSLLDVFSPTTQIKRYLYVGGKMGDFSVQFAPGGQLLLFKVIWGPQMSVTPLDRTGTWSEETVHGRRLIKLQVPEIYRVAFGIEGTPFYVEKDGQVKRGAHLPAGLPDQDDEFNFNKIAFDSLEANINFAFIPAPR